MNDILIITGILGAVFIGAASPGPSFLYVARVSVAQTRSHALAAAAGMGVGGFIFGGLAVAGLHTALTKIPDLYIGLKIAGGMYLLYLAWCLWRGAAAPLITSEGAQESGKSRLQTFLSGLGVQVSNPKTAIIYGSIFAAFLPSGDVPVWMLLALPPLVFAVEALWYSCVAMTFSFGPPRDFYLRSKIWVDRAAALVLALLGARIILDSGLFR